MFTPRPDPWIWLQLAASTLLIYLILLGAVVLIAIRLGRPLKDLTAAAKSFEGRGEAPQVEARGPADVRRALLAFNAMSERVSAMLDEKDRMLGAIGHDMRTPLASLRIRVESDGARGRAREGDRDDRGNDRDARGDARSGPRRPRHRGGPAGRPRTRSPTPSSRSS